MAEPDRLSKERSNAPDSIMTWANLWSTISFEASEGSSRAACGVAAGGEISASLSFTSSFPYVTSQPTSISPISFMPPCYAINIVSLQ